jgi:hypothetical protein
VAVGVNRIVLWVSVSILLSMLSGCGAADDPDAAGGAGRDVSPGAGSFRDDPDDPTSAPGGQRWIVYRNPRLGFEVEFPPTLLAPGDRPTAAEELELSSDDGEVRMRLSGRRGADEASVRLRHATLIDEELRRVASREELDDGTAVSGYDGTHLFHEMIRVRDGVVAVVEITYPESRGETMAVVAERILRSFAWTEAAGEDSPTEHPED